MTDTGWDFPTLAGIWEYRNGAILAGGDRLDSLQAADRERSLAALAERVASLAGSLDDGWLVATAFFMVEDIYKSFYREFAWTPGVHDYLGATAATVISELHHRGFVLHYVVDVTDHPGNVAQLVAYLPQVFGAAGVAVVGPQIAAMKLLLDAEGQPPADVTSIQRFRDEGHALADEVIDRWHQERRSSLYVNCDFDDGLPGLALDVALSVAETPGAILVFRNQAPTADSVATLALPPGVALPPELAGLAGSE